MRDGPLDFVRSIFDLVRDFMKDEDFDQQHRTLRKYLKPDLLIVDDMGLKQLPISTNSSRTSGQLSAFCTSSGSKTCLGIAGNPG